MAGQVYRQYWSRENGPAIETANPARASFRGGESLEINHDRAGGHPVGCIRDVSGGNVCSAVVDRTRGDVGTGGIGNARDGMEQDPESDG